MKRIRVITAVVTAYTFLLSACATTGGPKKRLAFENSEAAQVDSSY